ncbi:PH domain-containing protein [Arenibacter arenosicollis]|uniref:PH domain-containing protein n=1 Tax=Arenibacter arenosicollis TaxID=2762274 RepID=UPI0031B63DD7
MLFYMSDVDVAIAQLFMVRYKSKIGWILVSVMVLMLVSPIYLMMEYPVGVGPIILLLTFLFIIYIFLFTYYEVDDSVLRVKSGFLINRSIQINTITKIEATNNPISAPATSLDRLEIFYNTYESIIISPKEKRGFIAHLKQLNPDIKDKTGL